MRLARRWKFWLSMNPTGNHKTKFQTPKPPFQPPASGQRPLIIPIFLPHAGCPHRCVFCNQSSITGITPKAFGSQQLRRRVREFLAAGSPRRYPRQIAFYGGNFLGLKITKIQSLLEAAAEFVAQKQVDGIRFSTRPDTIDNARLDLVANYPVSDIELGVQSMDNRVLTLAQRGHSAADTVAAVAKLKARRLRIGLQMMVGLPGDNPARALASARKIAALQPDFVRIYPTLVVAKSRLVQWYRDSRYRPLSLEKAVCLTKKIYRIFSHHGIPVIRMGLQASRDLDAGSTIVAGPYHPAFGHLVHSALFLEAACRSLRGSPSSGDRVAINVHPRDISRMRGLKNANIEALKNKFKLQAVAVVADAGVGRGQLEINANAG